MAADRVRETDREWVERELRGVQGVFAQHSAQLTEHAAVVQSMQAEVLAVREEVQAHSELSMRELADSVVTLKGNIETTWTAHKEAIRTKDREVAEIVQEMRRMMAAAQSAAAESTGLKQEVMKQQRHHEGMMEELVRVTAQNTSAQAGLEIGMANLGTLMKKSEEHVSAMVSEAELRISSCVEQRIQLVMEEWIGRTAKLEEVVRQQQQQLQVAREGMERLGQATASTAAEVMARGAAQAFRATDGVPHARAAPEEDREDRRHGGATVTVLIKRKGALDVVSLPAFHRRLRFTTPCEFL